MASVLVVAPHGMDEVLGCGGTIALHAAKGDSVEILVLFGDGSGADTKRRAAGPLAARRLGAQSPRYAGFPENRGDTIPLVEIIAAVEHAIRETAATQVYVTHHGNLNVDHQSAYRAVVTAARPLPGSPVRGLYSYEVLSSTDWAPATTHPFRPTRFIDISGTLITKMAALDCYESDLRPAPHSRSTEGALALARHRGHTVGFEAAEAFGVIRERLESP